MNKGNFTARENFPVSTFTYDFLQKMSHLAGRLAQLGGANYILSGCEVKGTNVSEGLIVINGEMLPFEAGVLKSKITIQEIREVDHFAGINYPEAYIHRTAKCSDTGEYKWEDFVQVLTNKQLETKINSLKREEPGFVKMWSGRIDRMPNDYLLCDGRPVKTLEYPELAYYYGMENELGFSLPNLSKRFVVGYDNNHAEYNSIGLTGGKDVVTLDIKQIPSHAHTIKFVDEKWGDNANSRPFPNPAGTAGYSADTTSVGGGESHENRPPFYVLAYIVKVK